MFKSILALFLFFAVTVQVQAYDFRDAVRDLEPEDRGTDIAIAFMEFLHQFVRLIDKDENARPLFFLVREAIMDFDLARLYQSDYFSAWGNGFYGISFKGDIVSDNIDLRLITHEDYLNTSADREPCGSFSGEFAICKNLKPPVGRLSDTIIVHGDWISGDISWIHATRLLDNLMRVLDPDNLDQLRCLNGAGAESSFDVMNVFREDFPRFTAGNRILELSSSAAVKSADGCRYTDFTLKVGSDADGIGKQYPLVANYMKKMNKHGYMDIVLKDKQGRTLLKLYLGAQREFFRLRVCTRDGKVLPLDTVTGRPVPADAFSIQSLDNYAWEPQLALNGKAWGLKISIDNQVVSGDYVTDGNRMRLAHKMCNKPDVNISGGVLGIIPVAVIDMVIPGSVAGLADDFSTVMMQANQGEGTLFQAEWTTREPSANRLYWRAQTELPDNDFIRIGMKLFARMFLMDQDTYDEFRKLISTSMTCLLQDLQAMRRQAIK